jgi:predicted RNA-binding Zn ribbon-like protein
MIGASRHGRSNGANVQEAPAPHRRANFALDLLNTLGPVQGSEADRLGTPEALIGWLAARGLGAQELSSLRASPPDAAVLLMEARRLRGDLVHALEAFRDPQAPVPPEAVDGIDRVLSASSVTRRLRLDKGEPRLLESEEGEALCSVLSPFALAAAELLCEADPRRVRRCAAPNCSAWFLDTSKGGRRKWCSMATCGNRAKAAKHRRRRRPGRPTPETVPLA